MTEKKESSGWLVAFQVIPSLFWVFLIYCILGPRGMATYLFTLPIVGIPITAAGALILSGVILLGWEVVKSTNFGDKQRAELVFSLCAFGGALLFLLAPNFGTYFKTEVFLIIVALQFLDGIIGAMVMVAVARRDIGFMAGGGG